AEMPPANYSLRAQIFDANGNRLGVYDASGQFIGTKAELGLFESPVAKEQQPVAIENGGFLNLPFAGFTTLPESIEQGDKFNFSVWWQHPADFDADSGAVGFRLSPIGDAGYLVQFGNNDNQFGNNDNAKRWVAGQTYRLNTTINLGTAFTPGHYTLELGDGDENGLTYQPLAPIEIKPTDRIFELPHDMEIEPLRVQFDSVAHLRHFKPIINEGMFEIGLVWQAKQPSTTNYTMFIHLKNENGVILGQLDRPPIKQTGNWVSDEFIIDQVILDLPEGKTASIAIGLYDPTTGQRLPVLDSAGQPLPNQQFEIQLENN
ncbi:MAG: hypothetical protein AAGD96_17635, partial [Chloroflexota bacterium]